MPLHHRGPAAAAAAAVMTFSLSYPAIAAEGPFDHLHGNWSGGGVIVTSDGRREAIRCRAAYMISGNGNQASLSLRCAASGDSFALNSRLVATGRQFRGTWSEARNGATGTISGSVSAGHVRAQAFGPDFTATLSMQTSRSRQTVTIRAPGQAMSEVHVSMSRV